MERSTGGLLLTSSQVADLLQVHVSSVKRWTNEGDLPASTTQGGHRRIHLDHALAAARVRGIATYLDPFAPFQGHVWSAVRDAEENGDFRRVQSLAMGWLLREYPQRVGDLFVEIGNRGIVPFDVFLDRGIRPYLTRVSDAVREGRVRSAGEHLVTQILLEALFRIRLGVPLHPRPPAPRTSPVAVVGALEGDLHDVGGMGMRVLLEREGYVVHYLGPDVPVAEFMAAQRAQAAGVICLACSPRTTLATVQDAVRRFTSGYDPRTPHALLITIPRPGMEFPAPRTTPFTAFSVSDSSEDLAACLRGLDSDRRSGRRVSA